MKKFKKITLVLAAVSALAFSAQSAFAQENIRETEPNNSIANPDKKELAYQFTMLGRLDTNQDTDWFKFTPPANTISPYSIATITLASPPGYDYTLSITTKTGTYIPKTWLIQDGNVQQFQFHTEANTDYYLNVNNYGYPVNPNIDYQLSVN